ncbi:MAG: cysteine--tRNA ligase [Thermodesulfobacteriota bacterium]|nr:cysteine--tRNA ligase [Thermodesulfobacteriota bacterium]
MTLLIYNTESGKKSPLKPLEKGHVKLYVCGITAYDYCHIGHARSTLVFDMIVRYLRFRNYKVTYIRNFTDIDDKIINRAQEQHTTTEQLANKFIQAFHEDMESLGVAPPDLEPRATEHIPEIIEMIETLIDKGYAYQQGSDVYYRVDLFKSYGRLSGRNLDDMKAGARISINEKKQNPMDFALWKGSKPGEPTWDSPWGPGRPGWHIECSAMSRKYLGDSFDIHGGGKDLIFPHHENEIAQSEGATGKTFVKSWIHHGFVTIKDEKMSKSLGNFLTIRDILAQYPTEVLRFFIFSTHYRSPIDFSQTAMRDAESGLDRLYTCLAEIANLPSRGAEDKPRTAGKKNITKITSLAGRFVKAMDNDFNTAQAMGHIFEVVKSLNIIRQGLPKDPCAEDLQLLHQGAGTIRELAVIMGLLLEDPQAYIEKKQQKILAQLEIDPTEIDSLIQDRTEARERKNWALADEIRDKLLALNIDIKDGAEGTTWQVKLP